MCGLVGFYPKKGKKVDLTKLYPLWMLNEDRGTHSCGISYGKKRVVGTFKNSKARDLLADIYDSIEEEDLTNLPIIAHTRHATAGAYIESNAHPFKWYRTTEDNYFMFAHNGVIKDLYNLKKTLGMSRHTESMMVIDSHVLGLAMYDSYVNILEEKDILTNYDGNAAFLCYDVNGVFKAWKGANNNIEERPLYYVETKDGWYFCSLENSLRSLFLTTPMMVPNNTMMTFKNHKLVETIIYERKIEEIVYNTNVGFTSKKANNNVLLNMLPEPKSKTSALQIINNAVSLTLNNIIKPIKNNNSLIGNLITIATYGLNNSKGKHILKSNSKVINGDYEVLIVDNYAIITENGDKYNFSEGVLLKENYSYKNIQQIFLRCLEQNLTFEDIFNTLYTSCEHAIIDFIPLYDKENVLRFLIYKDPIDNYLDYITGHDKIPKTIPSKLGFLLQAYPANKTLFINMYETKK
jgi:predicted glutamine amidotransferase